MILPYHCEHCQILNISILLKTSTSGEISVRSSIVITGTTKMSLQVQLKLFNSISSRNFDFRRNLSLILICHCERSRAINLLLLLTNFDLAEKSSPVHRSIAKKSYSNDQLIQLSVTNQNRTRKS